MQPLDCDQTRRLLRAASEAEERLEALYVLAVHTGMRPGELLALKWQDVDLEGESLQVSRALSGGEFTAPKASRSRRRIDLTAGSVAALRAHRKRQLEERMQRAGLWQDHSLVFPSSVGTPLSHRNVVRSSKALLQRWPARNGSALRSSPTHLRDTAALPQGSPKVRPGASGPRFQSPHPRHLLARAARHG